MVRHMAGTPERLVEGCHMPSDRLSAEHQPLGSPAGRNLAAAHLSGVEGFDWALERACQSGDAP